MPGLVVEPGDTTHTQRHGLKWQEVYSKHQFVTSVRVGIAFFFQLQRNIENTMMKLFI